MDASMARRSDQTFVRFGALTPNVRSAILPKPMSRTGVRSGGPSSRSVRLARTLAMVAGMVVVVSLVGGRAGAGVNPRTQRAETRIYVVRPGDTVWSIAQGIEGP